MKTEAFLAIPIMLLLSSEIQAQDWYIGTSYGVAIPVSDTKLFTDHTSWRNWGVDVLAVLRPSTSVGVSFSWNVFNDDTTTVSSFDRVDVGGTQFRYINSLPILANVRQYAGRPGGVRPFVGLGVGAQLVKQRVDISQWRIEDDTWHFAVAPELGIVLQGSDAKWIINGKYHFAAKASDRKHSYFGIYFGIAVQTGRY